MRYLRRISEEEMVAHFLKTEIESVRFRERILSLLDRIGAGRRIVDEPNLNDPDENAQRMQLIGDFRGYGRNEGMFRGFPSDVEWYRSEIGRDELARVRYINYSYWIELSGGSRLPSDAAPRIRSGIVVYDQPTEGYLKLAEELREGAVFPDLILVGPEEGGDLIVLEGHVRLTVYALAPEAVPDPLSVIVGHSPGIAGWW